MQSVITFVTVCVAALSFSASCRADVIYSNLGPGTNIGAGVLVLGSASGSPLGAPNGNNGQQLFPSGGNFVATSFTVGVDFLHKIVDTTDFFPPGPGFSPLFDAYLYSNFQSQSVTGTVIISEPGMEIAEIGQALQAPSSPGLVTFSPSSPLNLSSGSLYWVILTPNNPLTFVTWDNNSIEVDGTLLTPEPATFGLLGLALPIIITLRKKRSSKS